MNSELELPSSVELIDQSIAEVHALLSALEARIKLKLVIAQPEIAAVEIAVPEVRNPAAAASSVNSNS